MKHERIVYDTREESGDLGTDALVSRDTNLYKDLPKETKILHSHISVEYRTCILQLKFKPGDNITHFYEGPVPEHFGLFRKKTKAHSLMTLVDVGVAARPARQKAPNYRT